MRIGITGVSGFIGSQLAAAARGEGHEVVGFSRSGGTSGGGRRFGEGMDAGGLDAMVHLAGEPVLGVWTKGKRERIMRSRTEGTRWVVEAIRRAGEAGPKVLVSGSATGYYGNRGDELLGENAGSGDGFLAEVTRRWEDEALALEGIARVVVVRTGVVIGRNGGAGSVLGKVFKFGLGGRLGSGTQWVPWIHLDDELRAILEVVGNDGVSGAVNLVAPSGATNADLTRDLAAVLRRPAFFHVPEMLLRMNDTSREMFLFSQRVVPSKLGDAGFKFRFAELGGALEDVFG
ncbi:MAG: TIGR01777 family oxidoreductase [Verrucomicrobiales bacterium]|nr:TIGR01777 family oxidoreductase [Verrucomicrobiales bacterium]